MWDFQSARSAHLVKNGIDDSPAPTLEDMDALYSKINVESLS